MRRRQYKNPPVIEALIEFRFEPSEQWDLTMPGRLHAALREEYPGKPEQTGGVESPIGADPNVQARLMLDVRLVNADRTRFVSIKRDTMSVHMLAPYQRDEGAKGWAEFQPRAETALRAWWDTLAPLAVTQVGLRYINRILAPEGTTPAEILRYAPTQVEVPEHTSTQRAFVNRVEQHFADDGFFLLTQATGDPQEGASVFMLDVDVIQQGKFKVEEAVHLLPGMRERHRAVFEAAITDRAREIFDA